MNKLINFMILPILLLTFGCKTIKEASDLKSLNDRANSLNIVMKGYQPIDPISVLGIRPTNPVGSPNISR
jgi:hypothetical protein